MKTSLEHFREYFTKSMERRSRVNHFNSLGLGNPVIEKGFARLEMPYAPHLVANPGTGAIASGALSALMDTCCAIAAATSQDEIAFCPTLDLRIDHLGVAEANKTLIAEARVYRKTAAVIFTRGKIYQSDPEQPVIRALVNFTPIEHKIVDTRRND